MHYSSLESVVEQSKEAYYLALGQTQVATKATSCTRFEPSPRTAGGGANVATVTGLSRETLYRTLGRNGNPRLPTLLVAPERVRLVPQVDGKTGVRTRCRDSVHVVAAVVRCVVDGYGDRPDMRADTGDGRLQCVNAAEVAGDEKRVVLAALGQRRCEGIAALLVGFKKATLAP